MSKREADEVTGVETTGHEWDGIKELDNPLPRWWLYVFWASIIVAIVYWVLLPAWPGINGYTKGVMGQSDRANVAQELQALRDLRGEGGARRNRQSGAEDAVGKRDASSRLGTHPVHTSVDLEVDR